MREQASKEWKRIEDFEKSKIILRIDCVVFEGDWDKMSVCSTVVKAQKYMEIGNMSHNLEI